MQMTNRGSLTNATKIFFSIMTLAWKKKFIIVCPRSA